jgi:hypothetical protein
MGMVPHLGNSVTMVSKTGPNQLVVGRRSAIGLTSAELDLLADWLESPAFPHGLNTFLGKPSPTGSRKRLSTSTGSQTNSVPGANK